MDTQRNIRRSDRVFCRTLHILRHYWGTPGLYVSVIHIGLQYQLLRHVLTWKHPCTCMPVGGPVLGNLNIYFPRFQEILSLVQVSCSWTRDKIQNQFFLRTLEKPRNISRWSKACMPPCQSMYTFPRINCHERAYMHHAYIYIHTYIRTGIHTYTAAVTNYIIWMLWSTKMYVQSTLNACMQNYLQAYIRAYIHMQLSWTGAHPRHTHTHTYIHTYIHTHICTVVMDWRTPETLSFMALIIIW